MKIIIVIFGLLVLCYTKAWGEDWRFIGETDRFISFYDAESIARSPKSIVMLLKLIVYNERGVSDMVGVFGKKVRNLSYGKFLTELNCKEKKLRYLQMVFYSGDGRILHRRTIPRSSKKGWYFFPQESIGEGLWEEVCCGKVVLIFSQSNNYGMSK